MKWVRVAGVLLVNLGDSLIFRESAPGVGSLLGGLPNTKLATRFVQKFWIALAVSAIRSSSTIAIYRVPLLGTQVKN